MSEINNPRPYYECENGSQFYASGFPSRCPVCGSRKIELVVEDKPEKETLDGVAKQGKPNH